MKPKRPHNNTFGMESLVEAQALNEMHPVPEGTIDSMSDFQTAVQITRIPGHERDYVEVTERLFKQLTANQPSETLYICWGSPTVRVFKEGTREKIEKWEALPLEKKCACKWHEVTL